MRQQKMMAWDTKKKEWYEDTFAVTESGQVVIVEQDAIQLNPEYITVDHFEVVHNIGITDSFNEAIFENDVIEILYDTAWAEERSSRHVIKYQANEDYPAYELSPYRDVEMNGLAWLKSECDPSVESYRVIGNIYENPELLEADHEPQ